MGKYLTEFSSNTEYNAALATLDYPNVSLVENELKYAESLPTMYRWVDDGDNTRCGDDIEYDGCTLYQQTKKQMSINGGQTWTDVVPAEYGYGDVIEEDSSECGCGEECQELDLADEFDTYDGQLVQGIKFGWVMPEVGFDNDVYIWDYFEAEMENGYIGRVHIDVNGEGDEVTDYEVTIYDDYEELIETISDYQDWSQWIQLCDYFSGRCMKLSASNSDDCVYDQLHDVIIKINNSEECSCNCFEM